MKQFCTLTNSVWLSFSGLELKIRIIKSVNSILKAIKQRTVKHFHFYFYFNIIALKSLKNMKKFILYKCMFFAPIDLLFLYYTYNERTNDRRDNVSYELSLTLQVDNHVFSLVKGNLKRNKIIMSKAKNM